MRWASSLFVVVLAVASTPEVAVGSDTITRWDSFSESSTCGAPYTRTPYVSHRGWLSDSERIFGPFGTYFGRSISEVRSDLTWWTVPFSGGRRVLVNRAILPDLKQVADGLAAEAAKSRIYWITWVAAFSPRTISGSYQLSRHALGLAIDINPARNPYRADNRLITNMPDWFVDAWREAGFCWGGDWKYAKDPMHFSWIGPGSVWSNSAGLNPRSPTTAKKAFGTRIARHSTEFAPVMEQYALNVFDGTGNGAPDVVGVRSHSDGSVIDIASSTYGYGECSIGRWFIEDTSIADADHIVFADIDGDSGQDLIALTASGGTLEATIGTRGAEFEDLYQTSTGVASTSVAVAGADFDGDGHADLWEATDDGRIRIWRGPGFSELAHEAPLPSGVPATIAVGDRDGGDTPELFALYAEGSVSRVEVLSLGGSWSTDDSFPLPQPADEVVAIGAGDYDGDGRSDVEVLDITGSLDVYLGNTPTGISASRWFLRPNQEDCDEDAVPLSFEGTFYDDDDSIFESNIESIAMVGVTKGCNPPFNDRFCPSDEVTRETMAAFLVRALGLTENTHTGFVDVVPGGTFAEDIGRLATAGITKGCNPPANDMFCPGDVVTRETMAAFIVRGLGLSEDTHPGFLDVASGNTFASDIGRLATAGITKGCNPPSNDRFCPSDEVTRETMAAFLHRAGLGG